MTQRKRLDAFLAEQAALAGAEFRDGTKVREIELDGDGRPTSRSATARARAPRCSSPPTARTASAAARSQLGQDRIFAPALEANVAYEAVGAGVERHVALLEMGYIPGGYGWVFPKGDHANVGVGGWDSQGPHLRDHLRDVCVRHGIAWESLTELRGHRLPMRGSRHADRARPRTRRRRCGRARRPALGRRHVRGVHERARRLGLAARRARGPRAPTSRPIRRASTPRSGATPRWPGSRRPRSSARPASRCASRARARSGKRFLERTATSRDPLTRRAPHPAWRRAEDVARRLLGPDAAARHPEIRAAAPRRSRRSRATAAGARTRRSPRARRRRRSGGR